MTPRRRIVPLDGLTPDADSRDGGLGPAVKRAPRWALNADGVVDTASVASSPLAVSLALLGGDLAPVLDGTLHPTTARHLVLDRWPTAPRIIQMMVLVVLRGRLR